MNSNINNEISITQTNGKYKAIVGGVEYSGVGNSIMLENGKFFIDGEEFKNLIDGTPINFNILIIESGIKNIKIDGDLNIDEMIKVGSIQANNVNCSDISCYDIKCENLNCNDINTKELQSNKINCNNINYND